LYTESGHKACNLAKLRSKTVFLSSVLYYHFLLVNKDKEIRSFSNAQYILPNTPYNRTRFQSVEIVQYTYIA